jgi:6-pyruvoyl-tetrahydropterin synthase
VSDGRAQVSLTRAIAFHARHRYAGAGPAADHGHLYRIEVTVHGIIDATRSMIMDLDALDALLTNELAEPIGGHHLNEVIEEFSSGAQQPSCEAFAAWCWRKLASRLPSGVQLERVRVAEDATLWADCTGIS